MHVQVLNWDNLSEIKPFTRQAVAVTIGVFDGLHQGHQRLIDAVKAGDQGLSSLVVTFRNNPATVFKPQVYPGDLTTFAQKVNNFQLYGVDFLLSIDFSLKFSKISGRDFLKSLAGKFQIRRLVAGRNFRFGSHGDTNVDNLAGFLKDCEIVLIKPVLYKGEIVSSTKIRDFILKGEIAQANAMLFRNFTLELGNPAKAQLPTGQIQKSQLQQIIPGKGEYSIFFESGSSRQAGRVEISDQIIRFREPETIQLKNIHSIMFREKLKALKGV